MFDAMKFDGDKITGNDFITIIDCTKILGIYPVKLQFDEHGEEEYIISSSEPTGRLIVFNNGHGETVVMYCSNDVETSCLVDLL